MVLRTVCGTQWTLSKCWRFFIIICGASHPVTTPEFQHGWLLDGVHVCTENYVPGSNPRERQEGGRTEAVKEEFGLSEQTMQWKSSPPTHCVLGWRAGAQDVREFYPHNGTNRAESERVAQTRLLYIIRLIDLDISFSIL